MANPKRYLRNDWKCWQDRQASCLYAHAPLPSLLHPQVSATVSSRCSIWAKTDRPRGTLRHQRVKEKRFPLGGYSGTLPRGGPIPEVGENLFHQKHFGTLRRWRESGRGNNLSKGRDEHPGVRGGTELKCWHPMGPGGQAGPYSPYSSVRYMRVRTR